MKINRSVLLCVAVLCAGFDPVIAAPKNAAEATLADEQLVLFNTDDEPAFEGEGFVSLFDGESLAGWTAKQGVMPFEVKDGVIEGRCVPGSSSTFLCTDKSYTDFVFTCEARWEVDGNSGVQVRSKIRTETRKGREMEIVFGPQVELEDLAKNGRGWSGGIYGQNCGGWKYPLRHPEHENVRGAIDRKAWNRMTVEVRGNVFKTWINGIPAAHWVDEQGEFPIGFIGLQVHGGKQGIIQWRELRIKEL